MQPISLQQVRQSVGGKLISRCIDAAAQMKAVCTDTRCMQPGSLFVALRGQNYDGHDYLAQAAAAGAVAALVQRKSGTAPPELTLIEVPDTRQAMGRLARFVRCQMSAKVIAVGGSNGKTGTKHLIGAVLGGSLRGSISPKSFNNDIGVPLTIFEADPAQDFLVLELGTNRPGEIRALTDIALPDVAVITNCSVEHLEGRGDLAGARREEASIIDGLNPRGLLVVNGDDPELLAAVRRYPGNRVTFGFGRSNDLYATEVRCDRSGVRFLMNGRREVFLPLLGRHVACNALAAIAVGRRMGLDEDHILSRLREARGPEHRLQLVECGQITVLNDAYNANPASMEAALETLCLLETCGRRVAVLGDMRELGDASESLHRQIGRFAASQPVDQLVCVGAQAAWIADSALQHGMPADRVRHVPDTATAMGCLEGWLNPGDLVLLKGSRAMRLETLLDVVRCLGSLKAAS